MASSACPTPLLLLLLLLLPLAAAAASLPPLPLSTASRWVVGADGRRVKLACANWASHLEPVAAEGLSRRGVGDIAARVAAMGFNCVRLTWPTYLATNATLASLPLRWSLERLGMRESVAGVRVNNPGLLDLPLIDVFQEVVSALARNNIMVILDNQMTTPGWCCSTTDGNGFFGDKYFDPEEWLNGLKTMATMFRKTKNVVGMSLRNELRGPYENVSLWYRYMKEGAEAVHTANPDVLVILSGLEFDNTLNFVVPNQIHLSFTGKLVFEQHWYGFSDGGNWESQNQNDVCGMVVGFIKNKGLFLLQQGWPLFFSEFGFDMSGTHTGDNRYLTCFLSVAAEMDLDWAIWALQGSYYIREGTLAYDESYGLLSWDWCTTRNPSFIKRINSLQSPFQGPGLPNSQEPYNVIFHPLSGLCVVVKSSEALELGPCDESNAWNYTSTHELVLQHTGQCLQVKSIGENAQLGTDCSKSSSKWQLISNSGMHVSTELTKNGTRQPRRRSTRYKSTSPLLLLGVSHCRTAGVDMRLVVVWLAAVAVLVLASHGRPAAAAAATTLSTASRWIVDEGGNRVKLACVNWPSHLEPMLAEGLGKQPVGAIAKDVVAMGFNCVRLTWATFMVTNASYSSLTVAQSFQRLNLTESLAAIRVNNPSLAVVSSLGENGVMVILDNHVSKPGWCCGNNDGNGFFGDALGENGVMVILDNHVSKPGWCCGNNDGNGFFGDAYFDPDVWVDGLTKMATMFAAVPSVVAMSLRNELRGPRQNSADWYKYMQRGAEAVHAANPRVVVILSGLSFDNDLAFLNSRQVNVSFAGKVAFEVHWYGFSDGQAWRAGNANQVCARVAASVSRRALYLLDQGWPVFLSEFGVDNRGGNVNDNRYYGCVAAVAADLDLDWALWTLQGSYYLREGVLGLDEVYGVLDWAWCKPRNDTALTRLHALQRPFRGPGLAEAAPYTVMFHPTTGRCVVRRSSSVVQTTLELGSCGEAEAWAYTASQQRLSPRDSPLLCLRAEGAGRPARLGLSCGDELARWSLTSDSKLHLAVNASSSSSSSETSNGGMLCLDVGDDGRSLVTNPCRCLSADNSCDPESQWFKLVTSTRSVAATNTMLAQLPPKLRSWKIRSL
uniref:Glycoside hydrolase family 5 domain-containing protein n=1 Tax=Oryza meridionalis TaxID=40149 RepID=A0A0E0DF98_9ORYZ